MLLNRGGRRSFDELWGVFSIEKVGAAEQEKTCRIWFVTTRQTAPDIRKHADGSESAAPFAEPRMENDERASSLRLRLHALHAIDHDGDIQNDEAIVELRQHLEGVRPAKLLRVAYAGEGLEVFGKGKDPAAWADTCCATYTSIWRKRSARQQLLSLLACRGLVFHASK